MKTGFFMVGMSQLLRILIVCHCFREEDSIIRIISARKDTKIDHDDGAMKQETRNRRRDAWDSSPDWNGSLQPEGNP